MSEFITLWAFPTYEINDEGHIRLKGHRDKRPLRGVPNQNGVIHVTLYKNREKYTRSVARLVASIFLEDPSRDDFNTLMHLDMDKSNCSATNLEWRPRHNVLRYYRQVSFPNWAEELPIIDDMTGKHYSSPRAASLDLGLLVNDVFSSVNHGNPVFPHGHTFTRTDR